MKSLKNEKEKICKEPSTKPADIDRKKFQENDESNIRLKRTFEGVPEGCQIIGYDWRYKYVNEIASVHGNHSKEELLGHTMMEVYPGIERTKLFLYLKHCLEKRQSYRFDNEFAFPDGIQGWFDIIVEPVPQGIMVLSRDITDRIIKEKQLAESETKYRMLFENSYDAILLTEPGGRIFSANPAACRMLGRSEEEICQLGRNGIVDQDDPHLTELLEERARFGKVIGQLRFIKKDGTKLTGEVSSTVFSDAEGQLRTNMVIRDESDRIKAYEALRLNEELYHTLVTTCPDGIVEISIDGIITFASDKAYELFGFPEEKEVIGKSMLNRIAPEGRETITANLAKTLHQGIVSINEYPALRKDGKTFWIETNSSVIKDGQSNSCGLIVIIRDISDRKSAEKSLVEERENFRNSLEMLPFGVQIISSSNQIVYANYTMLEMWGLESVEQLRKVRLDEAFTADSLSLLDQLSKHRVSGTTPPVHELTLISKSGQLYDVRIYGKPIVWNGEKCFEFLYEDITDRKKMESGIHNLNETLKLIRNINQLIVRVDNEEELLKKGCQELVNRKQYPLAWIGFIQEGTFDILPVAKAGEMTDYLSVIKVAWDDSVLGWGPTGTAIKTKQAYITREVASDSRFEPWREEAVAKGFKSTIALPLIVQNKVVGVLNIYSNIIDAFQEQELDLFKELAQDLSLGIEKIRIRAEQAKAEKTIEEEAVRRRVLIDQSRDGIVLLDEDGGVYDTNRRFAEMIGYTTEETRRLKVWDWEYQHSPEVTLSMIKNIDEKGDFFESKHKRKDGSVYDVEISSNAAMFGSRKLIFCVCRDITRRKEAQLELSRRAMLLDATSDAIMLHDLEGNILYANEAMCLAHSLKREQMHHLDLIDSFIIRSIPFPIRIQEILTNKKVTSELEVRTTDGTVRLIEVRSQIVQFEGHDLVLVIARDITERKKAEEQLVLRATLLDAATDAILLYDTEGNILYANDAMCRSYGMKREQMHNISFLVESLNDPNDYRKRIEQIQQNKTLVFEVEKQHSNGSSSQIEVRAQLVQIAGKELILNTARDITKRKKAEQVLLDRERQFRELAESISDVFFAVDKDLKITYWNQASERLTGITTENALGKRLIDIIPDNQRIQYMNDMFLMAIISGHPQHFLSNYTGEANIQEVDVYPTRDGVSVFVRDITEQEKTHQKLIESEERLHILFEDAPDAYCLYDLNGTFADGNRAAEVLSGYARSELIGTTFLDIKLLSRDEDYTKAKLLLEKNGQGEATGPNEVRITRKDGEFRDVEISTIPTMIGGQQMVLAIIRDITERKKMQENLIVTDRLASIGELASGMAHELNNPLTSVIGFADLLLEKKLPDDIRENISYMCREAKRTGTIVRNMLTFARKHPITKQSIDINMVISKVLEMRSYEHKINNITDIKNLADDLPSINADFFQIQQVILNIVINAEYFMKEAHGNGILTVTSEKTGQNIRISIADNGPGIPEDTLSRMFDPFFTTKPVGKGTGLGLSICYGIVSEHNGRIYAESELGKGAKFIIELPCVN